MKILWIIERKDGTTKKVVTEETAEPVPGDGARIEGIPFVIGTKITTAMSAELGKHDFAVGAIEQ